MNHSTVDPKMDVICLRTCASLALLTLTVGLAQPLLASTELVPTRLITPRGADSEPLEVFSERSLSIAIEVDRSQARILATASKPHAFVRTGQLARSRAYTHAATGEIAQIEVTLLGPEALSYTQRFDFGPICLSHAPTAEPHVLGDTIVLHRDSFVIQVPEIDGFDSVVISYYETEHGMLQRRELGTPALERSSITGQDGTAAYQHFGFGGTSNQSTPAVAGSVHWPEDFGERVLYKVYGDETEYDRRINITIVPDGYTHAEKTTMEAHADAMVASFRNITPYKEHDSFINYTLVYAYSAQSGTDQCDCGTSLNTAMGTGFPTGNGNCGDSANRCLYYGRNDCDTASNSNIVTAELRAPAHDESIIMVNTTRYGGCGGARSVYSAGNGSATDVAIHELGHSLGGLADEYTAYSSCGSSAGGINTSTDAVDGAWPEWIADLGAPREGAQYYSQCIYRPKSACMMRTLFTPFCEVCNQHWSLVYFGHPRISATAPLESIDPTGLVDAHVGIPADFTITTRFATGPSVTNSIEWYVEGPGFGSPTLVQSGGLLLSYSFSQVGDFTVSVEVTADTNFIKPEKVGTNRDSATFAVHVTELPLPLEVSAPGTSQPFEFTSDTDVVWEDTAPSSSDYNLYRGALEQPWNWNSTVCLLPGLTTNVASVSAEPLAGEGWYYLVTGANPAGEGTAGISTSGATRTIVTPCN